MMRNKIGLAAATLAGLLLTAGVARAAETQCKKIASIQLDACKTEVQEDLLQARANCLNLAEKAERDACLDDAKEEAAETRVLCRDQRAARRDLCEDLGEDRYAPGFDPVDFETDFTNPSNPNPLFPLEVGHQWHYSAPDEEIDIEVKDATKSILGVTCVVVNDVVEVEGQPLEDTDDWFAQRADGTVFYCGEISKNYELFPGDDPLEAELVDVEGSWKAGRDGALPGTLFLGAPTVGAIYRQELARGEAEDAAEVLSTTYAFGSSTELDQFVPAALANLLCANADCVVTREFSPISPDAFERKYYAMGVGLFLEVNPEDGEVVRLTDCNVAPVCEDLPAP